jgi:hypothetical protein
MSTDSTSASRVTPWQKATRSSGEGNCVLLRRNGDVIEVMDSKHPDGAPHRFTPAELAAFLDGAKKAEFDHLI